MVGTYPRTARTVRRASPRPPSSAQYVTNFPVMLDPCPFKDVQTVFNMAQVISPGPPAHPHAAGPRPVLAPPCAGAFTDRQCRSLLAAGCTTPSTLGTTPSTLGTTPSTLQGTGGGVGFHGVRMKWHQGQG